jgi:hypothetical protein
VTTARFGPDMALMMAMVMMMTTMMMVMVMHYAAESCSVMIH